MILWYNLRETDEIHIHQGILIDISYYVPKSLNNEKSQRSFRHLAGLLQGLYDVYKFQLNV